MHAYAALADCACPESLRNAGATRDILDLKSAGDCSHWDSCRYRWSPWRVCKARASQRKPLQDRVGLGTLVGTHTTVPWTNGNRYRLFKQASSSRQPSGRLPPDSCFMSSCTGFSGAIARASCKCHSRQTTQAVGVGRKWLGKTELEAGSMDSGPFLLDESDCKGDSSKKCSIRIPSEQKQNRSSKLSDRRLPGCRLA